MRPRKALLTQFPWLSPEDASAALRSAGGDLEKAMCIVSSSPRKPEKKSKAAANSKPRDLNVSMSLEEDEGTPLKQQPGKASGKKRYRGDRLIDQRTKLGRAAMHDMDKLSARELAARAAMGRFGGGDNSRSDDLPTVKKKKPARRDKQKPAKSRKQLGSSERKYKPVLTKKNPRREWDEDMEGSDFSESEIELMSEGESSGDDDSVLDRKKNAKKTMKSHMRKEIVIDSSSCRDSSGDEDDWDDERPLVKPVHHTKCAASCFLEDEPSSDDESDVEEPDDDDASETTFQGEHFSCIKPQLELLKCRKG